MRATGIVHIKKLIKVFVSEAVFNKIAEKLHNIVESNEEAKFIYDQLFRTMILRDLERKDPDLSKSIQATPTYERLFLIMISEDLENKDPMLLQSIYSILADPNTPLSIEYIIHALIMSHLEAAGAAPEDPINQKARLTSLLRYARNIYKRFYGLFDVAFQYTVLELSNRMKFQYSSSQKEIRFDKDYLMQKFCDLSEEGDVFFERFIVSLQVRVDAEQEARIAEIRGYQHKCVKNRFL